MFKHIIFLFLISASTFASSASISETALSLEEKTNRLFEKIEIETGRVSAFSMISDLAKRHGIEVWLEGESVDNLIRFLYSHPDEDTKFPGISDIFLTNELIQLVVRGQEYHRVLISQFISGFYPRQDEETQKNLWSIRRVPPYKTRPSDSPIEIQQLATLDRALRITDGSTPRINKSYIRFFVANDQDKSQKITYPFFKNTLLGLKGKFESPQRRKGFSNEDTSTFKKVFTRIDLSELSPFELVDAQKIIQQIAEISASPEHRSKRLELKYLGFEAVATFIEEAVLNRSSLNGYRYGTILRNVRAMEGQAEALFSQLRGSAALECKRFYK